MCKLKKLYACWYTAFWSFCCVGDSVGKSRIRFAAASYWVKASMSLFRTLVASDS